MGASPKWKVYDHEGAYQAATKEVEAAAALVAFYGPGSTIRLDHKVIVYTDGVDGVAADSYDDVANTVADQIERLKATLPRRG